MNQPTVLGVMLKTPTKNLAPIPVVYSLLLNPVLHLFLLYNDPPVHAGGAANGESLSRVGDTTVRKDFREPVGRRCNVTTSIAVFQLTEIPGLQLRDGGWEPTLLEIAPRDLERLQKQASRCWFLLRTDSLHQRRCFRQSLWH